MLVVVVLSDSVTLWCLSYSVFVSVVCVLEGGAAVSGEVVVVVLSVVDGCVVS